MKNTKKPIYFKEYKPYFYACISVMMFFLLIILSELILILIDIQTSINNVTINGAYERLMERYPLMLPFIVISFIGIFIIGRKDLEIYEDKIALPIKIYKIKEKKYIKYNDINRIYINKPKKYLKWFDPWLMFNFLDSGGKPEEKKESREGELIFIGTKDGNIPNIPNIYEKL